MNRFTMEAKFIKITNPPDASFILKVDNIPSQNPWHYHPEYEILYFINAKGTRFIGDSIENIENGELILLGQNLPHTSQRDKRFYEENKYQSPEVLVVQFDRNFLGRELWNKPEFLPITELLNIASRGLRFTGKVADTAGSRLFKIAEQKGLRRILLLLCLLEELAHSQQLNFISSPGFLNNYDETEEKINQIYEFTINNFREDISLKKIASLVYLSESAFCRYFKTKTRKTFSQFLAEVRIGYACKLLLKENLNISEICYECGYKNLSNFNRHFKDITQVTPSEYHKNFHRISNEVNLA